VAGYIWGGEKPYNLIQKVVEIIKPKNVLDVGCGPCAAMMEFKRLDCLVTGLDGDPQLRMHPQVKPFLQDISIHDLETGPWLDCPHPAYDLVWSYECAEHIKNGDSFADTVSGNCQDWIVMSHAKHNIGGYHHVNGQPGEYWIEKMKLRGFRFMPVETDLFKEANRKDDSKYFATNSGNQGNGLVFRRNV
jgi:hypothetical protein